MRLDLGLKHSQSHIGGVAFGSEGIDPRLSGVSRQPPPFASAKPRLSSHIGSNHENGT
jgi:hypothetical protein